MIFNKISLKKKKKKILSFNNTEALTIDKNVSMEFTGREENVRNNR